MENSELEILLVEDNNSDAELAIRALRKSEVAKNILHLSDGAAALEYLFGNGQFEGRNINNKPKVILLDLKMPKVSGFEVLEIIKTNELTKNIPVVVLTSSKEHPDVEKSYLLGANSYLVKPVDFESYHKTINEVGNYWLKLNQSNE